MEARVNSLSHNLLVWLHDTVLQEVGYHAFVSDWDKHTTPCHQSNWNICFTFSKIIVLNLLQTCYGLVKITLSTDHELYFSSLAYRLICSNMKFRYDLGISLYLLFEIESLLNWVMVWYFQDNLKKSNLSLTFLLYQYQLKRPI